MRRTKDGHPKWSSFQSAFESAIVGDPDMAKKPMDIPAVAGSLSHSHVNCTMRNILGRKKGCECPMQETCKCNLRVICDDQGMFNLALVKAKDEEWGDLCEKGITWEMLSPDMDVEEPEAALVISIALNKKNEASMKTAHTEIMTTLVSLCKPSPGSMAVPFEPVRERMVELYGAAVDHPDFCKAFQLVLDAGGHDSPHMKDLQSFINAHVNPRLRKMRWEAYAVAEYPVEFPKVKNASIKWAYRQPTSRGWCQLPPNIAYRFDSGHKHNMRSLMEHIEQAMREMSKLAEATLDDPLDQQVLKSRVRWTAAVDIGLVAKVFAVQKNDGTKTVGQQSDDLLDECAKFLAHRVREVMQMRCQGAISAVAEIDSKFYQTALLWKDNGLLQKAYKYTVDPDFPEKGQEGDEPNKAEGSGKGQREELAPKVIRLDDHGIPIEARETTLPGRRDVKVIDWTQWLRGRGHSQQFELAKTVLSQACLVVHPSIPNADVAILEVGGKQIIVKATKDIAKGDLTVAMGITKDTHMRIVSCPMDPGIGNHPHAVSCIVSWPLSAEERDLGIEGEFHQCQIWVQPELKLPKTKGDETQWSQKDSCYPFWAIRRPKTIEEVPNCDIVMQEVTVVIASAWKPEKLKKENHGLTNTYTTQVPLIVNTKEVKQDEELILKWDLPLAKAKKAKKPETWVDHVVVAERKRRKTCEER